MAIRTLIVDDEPLARETIEMLLKPRIDIDIVGMCKDGEEAIDVIRTEKPELVFLDIQMPGKNGFEVVEAIGIDQMPVIIFATAYDEYALQAFEANALDYLLKPFDDERFERALNRAINQIQKNEIGVIRRQIQNLVQSNTQDKIDSKPDKKFVSRMMIKERDSMFFIKTEDIDWVEAAGDYVSIHIGSRTHLIRETMAGMEKKLDDQQFVRIHRSTIINLERIKEFKPYFHGDYMVYLDIGKELRVSRRYWSRVEKALGLDT